MSRLKNDSHNTYDVSIVIACFNEELHLRESVADIQTVMDQTRYTYELIFVDDGSTDATRDLLQEIVAQQQHTKILFHELNQGRGGTVADGIRLAEGRYAGFLDIDLEVHARYIPTMIAALQDNCDVATAHRIYKVDTYNLWRHILSHGYRYLSRWTLKHDLVDTETGLKFFNRERILPVLEQVEDKGWFWDTEIMLRALRSDLKIVELPCLFKKRRDKVSTLRLTRDIWDYLVKLYRYRNTKEIVP